MASMSTERLLRLRPVRTFEGLQAEYETAQREGKAWCARRAKDQAVALALRTERPIPLWARDWK